MDHPFLNPSRKICTFFTKMIFFSCPSFFLPVPAKTNTVFGRSYDPFFLLICPIIYPNRARLPSIPVISRAGGHCTNTLFIRTSFSLILPKQGLLLLSNASAPYTQTIQYFTHHTEMLVIRPNWNTIFDCHGCDYRICKRYCKPIRSQQI